MPTHTVDSKSLTPDSIKVGTSGINAERFFQATASMRSLPLATSGAADAVEVNISETCPASMSPIAGAAPFMARAIR